MIATSELSEERLRRRLIKAFMRNGALQTGRLIKHATPG
jgi:hypothetical protein